MGKKSGKSLAEKYNDFLEPCVQIITSAGEIPSGEGICLEKAEVISSVGPEPDMAIVTYRADKYAEQDFTRVEKYLDAGQRVEIKAGYGNQVSTVFLGYLHQVEMEDFLQEYVVYTLICLDVKGLMMKNNLYCTSGDRKAGQVLKDILNDGRYGDFVKGRTIETLPEKLNPDCVFAGETHYDWVCALASRMDYEFFCGGGNMVFRKARKTGGDMVELSVDYGLQRIRGSVSMAGQTGCIQIRGYNRQDKEISGKADRLGVPGPFTAKLKQSLEKHMLVYQDLELDTQEEAEKRAKALTDRMAGKCTRIEAVTIGLPELLPGICAEILHGEAPSLSGKIYVEEVCHLLDEGGYTTSVAGARIPDT